MSQRIRGIFQLAQSAQKKHIKGLEMFPLALFSESENLLSYQPVRYIENCIGCPEKNAPKCLLFHQLQTC